MSYSCNGNVPAFAMSEQQLRDYVIVDGTGRKNIVLVCISSSIHIKCREDMVLFEAALSPNKIEVDATDDPFQWV